MYYFWCQFNHMLMIKAQQSTVLLLHWIKQLKLKMVVPSHWHWHIHSVMLLLHVNNLIMYQKGHYYVKEIVMIGKVIFCWLLENRMKWSCAGSIRSPIWEKLWCIMNVHVGKFKSFNHTVSVTAYLTLLQWKQARIYHLNMTRHQNVVKTLQI